MEQNQPQTQTPEIQDDPVSNAKKILEIEKNFKEQIEAIQEILGMIVQNKLDLEKMKKMAKQKLLEMSDENNQE